MKIRSLLFLLVLLFFAGVSAADTDESVNISKKELFSRARDALKTALETGDRDRAEQAFDYLKNNIADGAPLTRFEEYLINMELKNFGNGIKIYAELRQTLLDSTYSAKMETRVTTQDPLSFYLYRGLYPFTIEKADSLAARVDSSDISDEYKELYRLLLYSEIAIALVRMNYHGHVFYVNEIKDTTSAGYFLERGKKYVEQYPASPYVTFLKEQTVPFVENYMVPLREYRKDPFRFKYYTGGVNIFVYKFLGMLGGEASDYMDDKMGSSFMGELSIRWWRISMSAFWAYGLITTPKDEESFYYYDDDYEDEVTGFSIGFTAFDSRFVRVEPFIGFTQTNYMMIDAVSDFEFLVGNNLDLRLFAKKPKTPNPNAFSFTLNLRLKYMLQAGSVDLPVRDKSGEYSDKSISSLRHTFGLGLGFELW